MPVWLISLIVQFVWKVGAPFLKTWLQKRFPNWPWEQIIPVVQAWEAEVKQTKMTKAEANKKLKEKLMECTGVACPPRTKGD